MSPMARRAATIGSARAARAALYGTLALAVALTPAMARADGDPASDVLLVQNVFYPYAPVVSEAVQERLNGATAAAARAHFPLKVALIGSPSDLGVIPELFGKPQEYAAYLDVEISFERVQPVLVVMADGYGLRGAPAAATRALATIPKPAGGTPDALARAAITAVDRLAAAVGHPIAGAPAVAGDGGGAGPNVALLVVLVLGAASISGLLIVRRAPARRTGRGRPPRRPRRPRRR
jgi:hypothetical protein